jgi:periplasmic protein TonB
VGKLIERVEPTFPRDAIADSGFVRARLSVDGQGNVTNVEILESRPTRQFDRAVRNAASNWKYQGTGKPFTATTEITFNRQ